MAHPSRPVRNAPTSRDKEVLELRQGGKSFAKIALAVGLGSTREAHTSFLRALSASGDAMDGLRNEEFGRLTKLEAAVKSNTSLAAFDRTKKLDVIAHLRKQLTELG